MMKSILLTLCLLATAIGHAQTYHPLLKEGKQWYYYSSNGLYEFTYIFWLEGDTILGGESYHKIYRTMTDQWTGTNYGKRLYGLAREEGKAVYKWVNGYKKRVCDFSRQHGDRMGDYIVTAVDSIHAIGSDRVRMTTLEYDVMYGNNKYYWIEGVGCSSGLLGGSLTGLILLTCVEDGRCIFTGKNFTDMPPRAVTPERRPLLEEGKEWCYFDINNGIHFRMFAQGDTLIDGTQWKKIYRNAFGISYEKAMREEDGRVYELRPGGQPTLLMDFSLGVGDRFEPADCDDGRWLEVVAVDTMMAADIAHRRLILMQHVNGIPTKLTCWVEGVGSECGIDINAKWSDMNGEMKYGGYSIYDDYLLAFVGCVADGRCIYGEAPAMTNILSARPTPADTPPSYFDLQGRRLDSTPARSGLYIKDGRKVVLK